MLNVNQCPDTKNNSEGEYDFNNVHEQSDELLNSDITREKLDKAINRKLNRGMQKGLIIYTQK